MNKRGRLVGSIVRDNMASLLIVLNKPVHGYELAKLYEKVFGKNVSTRLIYYHLRKGKELGVFEEQGIERVEGNYSWGSAVERKMFRAGPNAEPKNLDVIKEKL